METYTHNSKHPINVFYCVAGLTFITLLATYYWFTIFNDTLNSTSPISSANIKFSNCVNITNSPPEFMFDKENGVITYIGVVSEQQKRLLYNIISECSSSNITEEDINSYKNAIDMISFNSIKLNKNLQNNLMLLGAASGLLGVLLRSIINLIGTACYKQNINLNIWWPYYVLRPLIGFILGIIIICIADSKILMFTNSDSKNELWWVAVAFLAGFGSDEFSYRLRSISKTLFGENPK